MKFVVYIVRFNRSKALDDDEISNSGMKNCPEDDIKVR